MKYIALVLIMISSTFAFAQNNTQPRVPHVFTGNSTAPAYQHYSKFVNKEDGRDSRGYAGYYLGQQKLRSIYNSVGVRSVHTVVRNIAKDGLCGDYKECFRVYVYVNGEQNSGDHVATFIVSPGTGRRTPLYNNAKLRTFTRSLHGFEKKTQFKNFDMYRIYGSKSYPDPLPNMPNAMFFDGAIALHGSFGKVNGSKQSHGCIRMNPDESYWLHSLVRAAEGNLTVDVFHTR